MFLTENQIKETLLNHFSSDEVDLVLTRMETYKSHWSHPPVKKTIKSIEELGWFFNQYARNKFQLKGSLGRETFNSYCMSQFIEAKNPKFEFTEVKSFTLLGDCQVGRMIFDVGTEALIEEYAVFEKTMKQVVLTRFETITQDRNSLNTTFDILIYLPDLC